MIRWMSFVKYMGLPGLRLLDPSIDLFAPFGRSACKISHNGRTNESRVSTGPFKMFWWLGSLQPLTDSPWPLFQMITVNFAIAEKKKNSPHFLHFCTFMKIIQFLPIVKKLLFSKYFTIRFAPLLAWVVFATDHLNSVEWLARDSMLTSRRRGGY